MSGPVATTAKSCYALAAYRTCPPKGYKGPVVKTASDTASSAGSASSAGGASSADSNGKLAQSKAEDIGSSLPTMALELPRLSTKYISKAEDLSVLPPGDWYVEPLQGFAAIDSIAIVGNKAYLIQITQNPQHDINAGLLDVLEWLPEQLEVEFVWVLPQSIWEKETFNVKKAPEQPKPDSSATDSLAAGKREMVQQRLEACKQQFKIPVQIAPDPPSKQPQPRSPLQPSPQASLRSGAGIGRTAAPGVRRLGQVCLPALAFCLAPHGTVFS